jgi:putative transposase
VILTFRYRIKDRSAKKTLSRHAIAANQVFNWLVAHQRDIQERYKAGAPKRKWATHFDLAKLCAGVGADLGIHQQTVQEICRQFAQSRNQHGCPRFRSSFGTKRALGWVPFQAQSRRVDGNSVTYRGKRFRFWEGGRPLPPNAKGGAFVEDARGRWYVTFHVEVDARTAPVSGAIGIDLGLKALATTSDGEVIGAPRIYRRYEQQLAVAQRAGNKRRAKAIHAKIKNCRQDFLHKATTKLAREHALIAVGDVNSKQLAKTKMAKSVLDAGWSSFRNMLRYKAAMFVDVDEKFTTQTCSCCGSKDSSERPKGIAGLRMREWTCSDCGSVHDRDVNAARNILALGAQGLVEGSRRDAA